MTKFHIYRDEGGCSRADNGLAISARDFFQGTIASARCAVCERHSENTNAAKRIEPMTYTECDEVADSLGEITRLVTFSEALWLAKRAMPDESHTVISNVAYAIMTQSRN